MKEPYIEGEAASLWPRVMCGCRTVTRKAVDRVNVGQRVDRGSDHVNGLDFQRNI